MKKLISLTLILLITTSPLPVTADGFYICRTDDCAMYVIEDSAGYSWYIECMDGSTASGRTGGASYGGNCAQVA